jgi:hypothetical protein
MGEGLKEKITEMVHIPRWIVLLIISLGLGVFVFNRVFGGVSKEVEVNTKRIEVVEQTKADKYELVEIRKNIDSKVDKDEFEQLDKHLNKIEDLILQHMNQGSKQK